MSTIGSNIVVAVDSMALVWGVRKQGPPDKLERAKWLFDQLDGEEAQVIVPAVAVSEFLIPTDPSQHAAIVADLNVRFVLAPFDVKCASSAARLFNEGNLGRPKGMPDSRKVLRSDCLIIATAATHGATMFYSHDADCRSLANKCMKASDLPNQPPTLFGYSP